MLRRASDPLHSLHKGDEHRDCDAQHVIAALGAHVGATLGCEEEWDEDTDEDEHGLVDDEALHDRPGPRVHEELVRLRLLVGVELLEDAAVDGEDEEERREEEVVGEPSHREPCRCLRAVATDGGAGHRERGYQRALEGETSSRRTTSKWDKLLRKRKIYCYRFLLSCFSSRKFSVAVHIIFSLTFLNNIFSSALLFRYKCFFSF